MIVRKNSFLVLSENERFKLASNLSTNQICKAVNYLWQLSNSRFRALLNIALLYFPSFSSASRDSFTYSD